jgi:CheY-like chemotaxis protein
MGKSGTGLGLTVVWTAMEEHDGKILVESNEQGTCFQLYFPISKKEETAQIEKERAGDLRGNGEHILVVDDEPQLLDIASQMLRAFGYKVDTVCSGELAVEFVKNNPVDLILIDMLMDPGMNGRQTYEKIITLYPNQKAIIVSGFSESDDVKAALQLGAGGFIKKPYAMDQLGRAVKETLHN